MLFLVSGQLKWKKTAKPVTPYDYTRLPQYHNPNIEIHQTDIGDYTTNAEGRIIFTPSSSFDDYMRRKIEENKRKALEKALEEDNKG